MLPRRDAPARRLPYTTADMSERLARRKADQANQALRFGVTNPPIPAQEDKGGGGGLWPSWGEIGNAIKSVGNTAKSVGGMAVGTINTVAATPIDMADWANQQLVKYVAGKEPVDQFDPALVGSFNLLGETNRGLDASTRRLIGDITAIPRVGKPSASPTATDIKQQGWVNGLGNAALDYGNLAATVAPFVGPVARGGINSYRLIKSGLADDLARFQAGNDAGVLGYGGRERPQLNLTGQPKPRQTAEFFNQLRGPINEVRGFGDVGGPFAEGISGIIRSSVENVNLPRPGAGTVARSADAMEQYINQLTSQLDSVPDWMKPPAETKPLTDPFADPNYQPPPYREIPMSPRRAEISATPRAGQNPVWPKDWDQVDLTKELDLTKKFDNPNQLDNVAPEIRNKWSAQQAFKENLIKQINEGDLYSFPKDFFPPGANTPAQQIRWLEVSSLKDLLSNPVLANEYIDLMRLFGQ